MNFGQAVRILRRKNSITQAQLAERCGLSQNAVCAIETGKSYPPKATIDKLCNAFGIPQSFMLMASIEEKDIPEEKRVLYRTLLEPLRNELLTKTEDGQQRDAI